MVLAVRTVYCKIKGFFKFIPSHYLPLHLHFIINCWDTRILLNKNVNADYSYCLSSVQIHIGPGILANGFAPARYKTHEDPLILLLRRLSLCNK